MQWNSYLLGQLCLSRPHQTLCKLLKVSSAFAGNKEEQLLTASASRVESICQLLYFIRGEHALCSQHWHNTIHVHLVTEDHKVVLYTLLLPMTAHYQWISRAKALVLIHAMVVNFIHVLFKLKGGGIILCTTSSTPTE